MYCLGNFHSDPQEVWPLFRSSLPHLRFSILHAHVNYHSESTTHSKILQAHSLSSPNLWMFPFVHSGIRVSAMSSISVPMSRLLSGPLSGNDTCCLSHLFRVVRWCYMLWPVTDLRISKWAEVDGGGVARGRCCDAARVLGAEQNPWRHLRSQQIFSTGHGTLCWFLSRFFPSFPSEVSILSRQLRVREVRFPIVTQLHK